MDLNIHSFEWDLLLKVLYVMNKTMITTRQLIVIFLYRRTSVVHYHGGKPVPRFHKNV